MKNPKEILLSVVIPCKNEEEHLKRCLESISREISCLSGTEIILVDCGSTDQSLAIAKQFPIKIIQLKPEWAHSPAAARYIGCLHATGKYIFIIDADMELLTEFIKSGIDFLEQEPNIVGVAGMGAEVYPDGGIENDLYKRKNQIKSVEFLGGAALYLNSALKTVGNFNPYLKAEEEAEISQRLKKAGYKLFSINLPMIKHYTARDMDNFKRRLNAGMFSGIGQMLRLAIEKRTFSWYLFSRFKFVWIFVCAIIGLMVATVFVLLENSFSLLVSLLGIIIFLSAGFLIKKGFKAGTLSLYRFIIISTQILKGLFIKTPDIINYPKDVIFIKRGNRDQE
ncbi:MAG: glycosyltransferase [Candidatus Omnitrophota bacterium]